MIYIFLCVLMVAFRRLVLLVILDAFLVWVSLLVSDATDMLFLLLKSKVYNGCAVDVLESGAFAWWIWGSI